MSHDPSLGMVLNEELEQTAFAGEVRTRLDTLDTKVSELSVDVKEIRSKVDKAAGVWTAFSILGSILGGLGTILGALAALGVFR